MIDDLNQMFTMITTALGNCLRFVCRDAIYQLIEIACVMIVTVRTLGRHVQPGICYEIKTFLFFSNNF